MPRSPVYMTISLISSRTLRAPLSSSHFCVAAPQHRRVFVGRSLYFPVLLPTLSSPCSSDICALVQLSASSAALDLALSPSPNPEASAVHSWSRINRHRTQQSLSSINGASSAQAGDLASIGSRPNSLRHSLDLKYISENATEPSGGIMNPSGNHNMNTTPPRLQSSFSANDVPTVKNQSGAAMMGGNANNHAQQHFHNHNASIGRIPAGAVPTRGHNRELSSDSNVNSGREQAAGFPSIQSALHASAPPFGPSMTSAAPMSSASTISSPTSAAPAGQFHGFFPTNGYAPAGANGAGNFGIPMLAAQMQQMNMNGVNNGNTVYPPQNYTGYGSMPYNPAGQRDSQARVIQHRRQLDNEG